MNRRTFNKLVMTALAGPGLLGSQRLFGAGSTDTRDRFGGWTGKRFEATGYFRTAKDDRWWLVTPEGNAFLSFGINHLHSHWWNQDYNRAAWKKRLGVKDMGDWQQFGPALRTWFLQVCRDYGFNTVGVHSSLPVVNQPHPAVPYMQPIRFVDIPHWRTDIPDVNFLDVFSPEFAQRCDTMATQYAAPAKDDPFLLGYSMTDCPLFTEEDCRERPDVIGGARRASRIGWPRRLRNLDSSAAGKHAYVQTMRNLYRSNIHDFNSTYNTDFKSFDALLSTGNWRAQTDLSNGNETRDNVEFLKIVVDKYYRTAKEAIRRYDPNHLFFGDKINANTDTLDTVLPVTIKYTDVVFYQMYARYEVQQPGLDRWSKIADKPIVNGDSAFTMVTESLPRPYGPVADNLTQRIEWTEEFFEAAFARPDFVGWHYCGLIDAPNLIPGREARQHSGMMDGYGTPYPGIQKALKAASNKLYDIAIGDI